MIRAMSRTHGILNVISRCTRIRKPICKYSTNTDKTYRDDILTPLSIEKFAEYRSVCAKHFPAALRTHHSLLVQERWQRLLQSETMINGIKVSELSPAIQFKFFVPKSGDITNCTLMAMVEEPQCEEDYSIFAFTIEEDSKELSECFQQTKRIRWARGPFFIAMGDDHLDVLDKYRTEKGLVLEDRKTLPWFFINMWLPKEEAAQMEYEIPNDLYIAQLSPDEAKIINDNWPYRSDHTEHYIRSIIALNADGCFGVYDKSTNELLSYMLTEEHLCMGFLHSMETARGRGIAKLLTKFYCKEFAKRENLDIITYISVTNTAALNLIRGLGFRDGVRCTWTKLKRTEEIN